MPIFILGMIAGVIFMFGIHASDDGNTGAAIAWFVFTAFIIGCAVLATRRNKRESGEE
jgi:lipopolysaccharide export LptBFGC system permease protein LptF